MTSLRRLRAALALLESYDPEQESTTYATEGALTVVCAPGMSLSKISSEDAARLRDLGFTFYPNVVNCTYGAWGVRTERPR